VPLEGSTPSTSAKKKGGAGKKLRALGERIPIRLQERKNYNRGVVEGARFHFTRRGGDTELHSSSAPKPGKNRAQVLPVKKKKSVLTLGKT